MNKVIAGIGWLLGVAALVWCVNIYRATWPQAPGEPASKNSESNGADLTSELRALDQQITEIKSALTMLDSETTTAIDHDAMEEKAYESALQEYMHQNSALHQQHAKEAFRELSKEIKSDVAETRFRAILTALPIDDLRREGLLRDLLAQEASMDNFLRSLTREGANGEKAHDLLTLPAQREKLLLEHLSADEYQAYKDAERNYQQQQARAEVMQGLQEEAPELSPNTLDLVVDTFMAQPMNIRIAPGTKTVNLNVALADGQLRRIQQTFTALEGKLSPEDMKSVGGYFARQEQTLMNREQARIEAENQTP